MNAVVEINDMLGLDYYYVSITFLGNAMLLNKPEGLLGKYIEKKIILSQIDNCCMINEKGVEKLIFCYDNESYTFIDYENNILSFLQENLDFVLKRGKNID